MHNLYHKTIESSKIFVNFFGAGGAVGVGEQSENTRGVVVGAQGSVTASLIKLFFFHIFSVFLNPQIWRH